MYNGNEKRGKVSFCFFLIGANDADGIMVRDRKLGELADIRICTGSPGKTRRQDFPVRWLGCADFLKNNMIALDPREYTGFPDPACLIRSGDIVVKRIAPTFVNYIDEIDGEVFAGNNLIVITPGEEVYSRYVAMLLNEGIRSLAESDSVGAVMKSVNRTSLENIRIPCIPYEKQKLVGDLWYYGIELEKKKDRLAELETIKNNHRIKEYVETYGGNQNG